MGEGHAGFLKCLKRPRQEDLCLPLLVTSDVGHTPLNEVRELFPARHERGL
jgi:hypothetical protein